MSLPPPPPPPPPAPPGLRRAVTLPLLVFYGLGVTIGAGIYVLIGETVALAGPYAPSSFLLAAVIMAFNAGSFCELSGRYPQSAGEAIYVEAAFARPALTLLTGGLMVLAGVVSAAAIAIGGTGYIRTVVELPEGAVLTAVILSLGAVAGWGIVESLRVTAVLTVLELLGLVAVIAAGFLADPGLLLRLPELLPPPTDGAALSGVLAASVLAFFAFIGFDDMVNLSEEIPDPRRVMPTAIVLALVIVALLYFLVAAVAVLSVPLDALAGAPAPISLIFGTLTGAPPLLITMVAIVATLNGVVILIVMAARVLYGLGSAGRLPGVFARVHPVTRTPLVSTVLVTAVVLALALWFPIGTLAERATQVVLVIFLLINLALLVIKRRGDPVPPGVMQVPLWVPFMGLLGCLFMLVAPLFA